VTGYARGRVCYISPIYSQDFRTDVLTTAPKLTKLLKRQIEYICSLFGRSEAPHSHISTETNILGNVSSSTLTIDFHMLLTVA
jgi:hypothetical protein